MTTIKIINNQQAFVELCEGLAGSDWLALDTEFMREKTYTPVLALIQIANDQHEACIDPLAIEDLSPFGRLLEDTDTSIILHSCRQDLEALDTLIDENLNNLFDTQIAAAFCGHGDQVSYAAMVENFCGVELAKSHTRADWTRRPLSDPELEYALDDVRYLQQVRESLYEELVEKGRLEWFEAECRLQVDPGYWRADPLDAWRRLKGAAGLPVEAHEAARALSIWREQRAIRRNLPREWVLSSAALLQIARQAPAHRTELAKIEGVNTNVLKYGADEIIAICEKAPRDQDAAPLWVAQNMLEPTERKRVKSVMSLLRQTAEQLEISPSLLANRAMVERYVRGENELPLFQGWRLEVAGEKIIDSGL